jgi:hypothetical protein
MPLRGKVDIVNHRPVRKIKTHSCRPIRFLKLFHSGRRKISLKQLNMEHILNEGE